MGQRSRQRHVGQDKLGGRGSDVYRKIQQVYQHGHVDDSPPMPNRLERKPTAMLTTIPRG